MIIGHFLKQEKEGRKNKKYNRIDRIGRITKDGIIRDIRTAFEQEEKEESFISLKE